MRFAIPILLVLLAVLQYKLWFNRGGVPEVIELRELTVTAEQENSTLAERNAILAAEIEDLKEGYNTIEEQARSDLGMVREGEVFYQVIE